MLILCSYKVRDLVDPYMQWTALTQSWDTFAPDPKAVNAYVKAVVITRKHHIHVWTFPRMEQLSFTERYRKERYRKFAENLVVEKNAILLPDVAGHVACMYKNPADPPEKSMLIQFLAEITPWGDDARTPRPTVFYEDFCDPRPQMMPPSLSKAWQHFFLLLARRFPIALFRILAGTCVSVT